MNSLNASVGFRLRAVALMVVLGGACDANNTGGSGSGTGGSGGAGANVGKGSGGIGQTTGGTSGTGGAAGPVQQCHSVVDVLCRRMVECIGDSDPANNAQETAACQTDVLSVLPCDRTLTAEPSVTSCTNDLGLLSCSSLFPGGSASLPPSCFGLFSFTKTVAEMQCEQLATVNCQRILECDPALAGVPLQECVDQVVFELECPFVTGVSSTFNMCISEMQTGTCATLFPPPDLLLNPPASCLGVLQ